MDVYCLLGMFLSERERKEEKGPQAETMTSQEADECRERLFKALMAVSIYLLVDGLDLL
jgi:hypothetical protein